MLVDDSIQMLNWYLRTIAWCYQVDVDELIFMFAQMFMSRFDSNLFAKKIL